MVQIRCKEALYSYDAYHMVKAFWPEAEVEQKIIGEQESLVEIQIEGGSCFFAVDQQIAGFDKPAERKREVTRKIYDWLAGQTNTKIPWGILTGIRPTKLISGYLDDPGQKKDIIKLLSQQYYISEEKARLGIEIARRERALLRRLDYQKGYSLYIGIPFCPTTCSYCSFTSYPIKEWKHKTSQYLTALFKELSYIARAMKGKSVNTIYIGGGTPTSLTAEELNQLLIHVVENFSDDRLIEFTVEAGRPDSITREKLEVLKQHGITRISINPQTMQQPTLDRVGRKHTVRQIADTYDLARELGFDNINMDLIAGLPGEDQPMFEDTLRQIKELAPDSMTVHSLAIKRAARMGQERQESRCPGKELSQMITSGAKCAREMEMDPYYLYRQKNIAGSFENVGYAKVDKAGIYNILIMEEVQSIIAAGAGVTTKVVLPEPIDRNGKETSLIRIENVKDVKEYILRIDEMIKRKEEWIWR